MPHPGHLFFCLLLMACVQDGQALADEAPGPASADSAQVSAITSPVTAETLAITPASSPATDGDQAATPRPVIVEPAVEVETDADKLRKKQLLLAPRKIDLLRSTVRATPVDSGFLSSLFSSPIRPIDVDLLAEMDSFIDNYSELPETAEVYQLKAQVHMRIQNYPAAALDWLMLLAAYPDSAFAADARKGLQELSGDKLQKKAATIKSMMDKLATLSGGREQREADYLDYLGSLSDADFATPITAECAAFLERNKTYPDEDRIIHAQAHQEMLLDNEVALYQFNKLLVLYPDSPLRPDSLLAIGNIERNGMKLFDLAAGSYKEVIKKYPDTPEAKQAYEALAGVYEESLRDYASALKTYDEILARYNNDPVVLRSLQAEARIFQDKTGQPLQAIAAYRKLADLYKGKEGLDALLKAEKLALYTVKDWKLCIAINDSIAAGYPDSDEAAKALFGNAVIYEQDLHDNDQAIAAYQDMIKRYPGNSLVVDARRRIGILKQKK